MANNLEQIAIQAGNIAVMVKQVHGMAQDQFNAEYDAGSRSQSRSILLCEIGTSMINIEYELKKIRENIDHLNEIPQDYTIKENPELFLMR